MSTLRLRLLGAFDIQYNDLALPKPPTLKSQSLLAYLICHRDRPQRRDKLVDLFWGDRPERKARRSLATALWHIRHRCLPDDEFLMSDARTVQFNPQADLWLDVDEFVALAARDDMDSLQTAVALYRGAFLEDFYDDWVINERYRLEALLCTALERLMAGHEAQEEYKAALAAALRLLRLDPLREDAHRLVMRAYCRLGQRNAALEQYRRCREVTREELGVEPMAETTELYQAILAGWVESGGVSAVQAAPTPPLPETVWSPGRMPLDAAAATPLVGREPELARLQQWWRETQAGQGRLILIGGEAGIGKSCLIQTFAEYLRWEGSLVLWGRCYEFERFLPYQPLAELLQAALPALAAIGAANLPPWVLGEVARLAPELLEQPALACDERLPNFPIFPAIRSDQERGRLFDGVARFLAELANHSPLLIVLEDLHWATETTLQLLHYLARRLTDHAVLLAGSYRSGEMAPQHPWPRLRQQLLQQGLAELLPLPPLSETAVEKMIAEMSGAGEAARPLARQLHRKTEGNPLFIMEIIKTLFETGVLRLEQGRWQGDFTRVSAAELPLPAGVSELIRERVGRLDETGQAALQQAAVLGREFDFDVLNALRGEEEEATLKVIDTLLRRRLIAEGMGQMGRDYAFTHHLIQEVVYANIPRRRRQHTHARAGQIMQTLYGAGAEAMAGELAFHFRQGQRLDEALLWTEKAADQARRRYAIEEAAAYYKQALDLAQQLQAGPGREAALRRKRAEVLLLRSAFAEARSDLARALALAQEMGEAQLQAELLLVEADLHIQVNDFAAAVTAARAAFTLAETCQDKRLAGMALRFEGEGLYFQGQSQQACARAKRASAYLQQAGAVAEEGWAHFLLAATRLDLLGEFESACAHLALAYKLFERGGCLHGQILADHLAGNTFLRQGDWETAVTRYTQALNDARRIGYGVQEAIELAHLAISYARLGDLDAAEQNARACRQLSRQQGIPLWESYGVYWLGHVAYERGHLEAAGELMAEALSLATQVNYQSGIAFVKNRLSCLSRAWGAQADLQQALAYAQEAYQVACQIGSPPEQIRALSYQAMACLALGRLAEALSFSEQAVVLAGEGAAQDFSSEVLFNHAQVLAGNGRAAAAQRYRKKARADLLSRAEKIQDPQLRRSFLENVRANREILATSPNEKVFDN